VSRNFADGSVVENKAAAAWRWPLTLVQCRS